MLCVTVPLIMSIPQDLMVKNVKRYMKQQKKDILPCLVADFVPVTYILPQVSLVLNAIGNVQVHSRHSE